MRIRFIELISNKKHILTLLAMLCVCVPLPALAATLTLSPSSTSVSVGNITTVSIKVNTGGLAVNNAEGVIQFPNDVLEVVSISKNSSIFTLWVEEPSFSNGAGRIVFNGGAANPGFNGSNGTIASIVFKAKKQGTASVLFTDGAVRKNDGLGTDILSSKSGSTISITTSVPVPVPTPVPVVPQPSDGAKTLSKPVIVSATHPDQNSWYNNKTVSLNWKVPGGVTSLQTLFNKVATSTPTTSYDSSVTQKTVTIVEDGIYYFHLRYLADKVVSPSAHFAVQVDSTPPKPFSPTIRIDAQRSIIKIEAQDTLSGIDHYALSIDAGTSFVINKNELVENEYVLPFQKGGSHIVLVSAYDKAGNYTDASTSFISQEITTPEISLSVKEIIKGKNVTIFGTTNYPNSQIEILLELNDKELERYTQTTGSDGSFSVETESIEKKGIITISAQSILSESVHSPSSEKQYLTVRESKSAIITMAALKVVLSIVGLLVLLTILYVGWHKFFSLRRRIERDTKSTASDVHTIVVAFKEELSKHLYKLELLKEDRELNKKEEEIFEGIKKQMDDIDKFIEKKLKKLID